MIDTSNFGPKRVSTIYLSDQAKKTELIRCVCLFLTGNWKNTVQVPKKRCIKSLEDVTDDRDRLGFLDFLGAMLHWVPEERLIAKQALQNRWLHGHA